MDPAHDPLVAIPAEIDARLRALLAAVAPTDRDVDLAIHRDDLMLEHAMATTGRLPELALVHYLRSAHLAVEALDPVLARLAPGARVLDFASGHGRVTRLLVRRVPPARLAVADLMADAVAFQTRRFGVRGIPSTTDPAALDLGGRWDAILVLSLFTHLPEARFGAWMRRLVDALAPGGVLVFSVHDRAHAPADGASGTEPLLFTAESENPGLDPGEYGTTWVTEGFVREAVAEALARRPDLAGSTLRRVPLGLWHRQDLWVLGSAPLADALAPAPGPVGFVDAAMRADGVLGLAGWATAADGPARVELRDAAGVLTTVVADRPRPDVAAALGQPAACGWELAAHVADLVPSAPLMILAVDGRGRRYPLHAASVATLPLSVRIEQLAYAGLAERGTWSRERERRDAQIGALYGEIARLTERLAALEGSRAWRFAEGLRRWRRAIGAGS